MSLRELVLGQLTYLYRALIAQWANPYFLVTIGFWPVLAFVDWATRWRHIKWSRGLVKSIAASTAIYLLNCVFVPVLLIGATKFRAFYDSLNIPHVPESAWKGVPGWALMLIAIVAADFANYWVHRVLHWKWFWPVHAIHHSDPDVNAATALRIHALESLMMACSYVVILGWMALPATALGLGRVFMILHNQYVHMNIDWAHGPLKLVIGSPRFHRWHHADVPEAYGKNLAGVFPIFDVLFGTYYEPGACRERVGAEGVPENDVVRLVFYPFLAWGRMVRGLVAGTAPVTEGAPPSTEGIDVDSPDAAEGPDDVA